MRTSLAIVAALALAGCGDNRSIAPCEADEPLSVLVFTRENQWTHTSNPIAAVALAELGAARGWRTLVTADPAAITTDALSATDVVVFSLTSGNVLGQPQRDVLEAFFTTGGGFAGTHSASSTEHEWPFYKMLVPAVFKTHPVMPHVRPGRLTIEAPAHPIVAGLPDPWSISDEFYTFYERPETLGVDVLLALDETSVPDYPPDIAVGYHPLAWTHEKLGGRAFYTALGHPDEVYANPQLLEMLERGIEWAGAARYAARCGP